MISSGTGGDRYIEAPAQIKRNWVSSETQAASIQHGPSEAVVGFAETDSFTRLFRFFAKRVSLMTCWTDHPETTQPREEKEFALLGGLERP